MNIILRAEPLKQSWDTTKQGAVNSNISLKTIFVNSCVLKGILSRIANNLPHPAFLCQVAAHLMSLSTNQTANTIAKQTSY